MKLDLDCIRDVLLALETHLKYDEDLTIDAISLEDFCQLSEVSEYSTETILYTAEKLHEGGFIELAEEYSSDGLYLACFTGLTFDGHQFLEAIRPQTVFDKTKSVVSKIGGATLDIVKAIGTAAITQMANKYLGIN